MYARRREAAAGHSKMLQGLVQTLRRRRRRRRTQVLVTRLPTLLAAFFLGGGGVFRGLGSAICRYCTYLVTTGPDREAGTKGASPKGASMKIALPWRSR